MAEPKTPNASPDGDRPRVLRALMIATLVLGAAFIGLGLYLALGGEDDELTREELIAQGDEICRSGQEQFARIQADPPEDGAEAAEQTAELIAVTEEEISALRNLAAPDQVAEQLDRYIAAREEALALLEEGREAAEQQDARGYGQAQSQVASRAPERLRLARAVGFEVCSNPRGLDSGAGDAGPQGEGAGPEGQEGEEGNPAVEA